MRTRGYSGFSLVELLVVIAIIAVLMGLLLPVLSGARANARAVACMNQMREFGAAMQLYGEANNGLFVPPNQGQPGRHETWAGPVLGERTWEDVGETRYSDAVVCPADPTDGDPDPQNVPTRNSYVVNSQIMAYKIKLTGPFGDFNPADVVVMGEKRPDAVGWVANDFYSISTPSRDWWHQIDLVRHGTGWRSNHLIADLHVDHPDLLKGRPLGSVGNIWPTWGPSSPSRR